jgi:hypothetical protein
MGPPSEAFSHKVTSFGNRTKEGDYPNSIWAEQHHIARFEPTEALRVSCERRRAEDIAASVVRYWPK